MDRPQWGWTLYDWANTAFSTLILTFVYSVFFAKGIVGDDVKGAVLWSYAISISGIIIAFTAPFLGSAVDKCGRPKRLTVTLAAISIMATALLWFGTSGAPDSAIYLILLLVIIANTSLELSLIFYNALLKHIAPPAIIGRISGYGWGLGYIGGLLCLIAALLLFIGIAGIGPFISLPQDSAAHIRIIAPLVALWYLLFALPLALWCPDVTTPRTTSFANALKTGAWDLWQDLKHARKNKNFFTYLIASMFYRDGLATLFAIGGLYAAGVYQMDMQQIMIFAIGLNLFAGVGAFAFSAADDKWGSKKVITICLCGLIISGLITLLAPGKTLFMGAAFLLGIFIGPAQAASRTFISRIVPKDEINKGYGLYAFTGKSTAFMGPFLYGLLTTIFESQKAGMFSILAFWVIGLILVSLVHDKKPE